jgi:hypothetical protein
LGYLHCIAHCEATRVGTGGLVASHTLGILREGYDLWKLSKSEDAPYGPQWGDSYDACAEDLYANDVGRTGNGAISCNQVCAGYKVKGLPD